MGVVSLEDGGIQRRHDGCTSAHHHTFAFRQFIYIQVRL